MLQLTPTTLREPACSGQATPRHAVTMCLHVAAYSYHQNPVNPPGGFGEMPQVSHQLTALSLPGLSAPNSVVEAPRFAAPPHQPPMVVQPAPPQPARHATPRLAQLTALSLPGLSAPNSVVEAPRCGASPHKPPTVVQPAPPPARLATPRLVQLTALSLPGLSAPKPVVEAPRYNQCCPWTAYWAKLNGFRWSLRKSC
eukprot:gene18426-24901_t